MYASDEVYQFISDYISKYAEVCNQSENSSLEIECRLGQLQENLNHPTNKPFFNTFISEQNYLTLLNHLSNPAYGIRREEAESRYRFVDKRKYFFDEEGKPLHWLEKEKLVNADFNIIGSFYDLRLSMTRERIKHVKDWDDTDNADFTDIPLNTKSRTSFFVDAIRFDLSEASFGHEQRQFQVEAEYTNNVDSADSAMCDTIAQTIITQFMQLLVEAKQAFENTHIELNRHLEFNQQ